MQRDILGYVSLLNDIKSKTEFKQFVNTLRDFTVRGIYTINGIDLAEVSEGEIRMYRDLFGNFTVEQLAGVLNKISKLTVRGTDIELNLLLLGYTGVLDEPASVREKELDTGIIPLSGEATSEINKGARNREAENAALEDKGIQNAEVLTKACNLDSIQALFGASTVE